MKYIFLSLIVFYSYTEIIAQGNVHANAGGAKDSLVRGGCISGNCETGQGDYIRLIDNHGPVEAGKQQYLRMTGRFDNRSFKEGTFTLHGFSTQEDGSYEVSSSNYYGFCLSGNCKDGRGLRLNGVALQKGKFKNDLQVKGTIELYAPAMTGGEGVFTIKDPGYSQWPGTFKPAGVNFEFNSAMDHASFTQFISYRFDPPPSRRCKNIL